MTAQDAYIEGFCKAAEAHGVDPNELIKVAVPLRELLEIARSTGKVNNRLAMALTNIGKRAPRFARVPAGPRVAAKRSAQRASGQRRATAAVGDFYGSGGITALTPKNPASKVQRFWAEQLTHPEMTLPTGLEWNKNIFTSGLQPSGIHMADLRDYLLGG